MSKRVEILNQIYENGKEENRLDRSRNGQLEYITTMRCIHRFAKETDKILEIGAGTGRYSIALAKEGYSVTAVELVQQNLEILQKNSVGIENLSSFQADALDLSQFAEESFDMTLVFGPMYHLYKKEDVQKAIEEAIRVTKKDGVILFAFLSVYAIMFNDYMNEYLKDGLCANFTEDYKVKHFEEQVFTGYDIVEFEQLFEGKQVTHMSTVAADTALETVGMRKDFAISDEGFEAFVKYHLATCEKRELLGCSSHLLYICRKR